MDILEKRIAEILAAEDVSPEDIRLIIAETEAAITQAEATAEAERAKALDPIASPDATKAHAAMEAAAFARDRLRTVLSRLQARYKERQGQERYDAWAAEFDKIKPRHDAAVVRLKEVYTKCEAELVAVLSEAEAVDAEVRRVSYRKPHDLPQANSDGRILQDVELAARGLDNLGYAGHSLVKDVKLPAFDNPAKLAWPHMLGILATCPRPSQQRVA